jgi:hypothetical protein
VLIHRLQGLRQQVASLQGAAQAQSSLEHRKEQMMVSVCAAQKALPAVSSQCVIRNCCCCCCCFCCSFLHCWAALYEPLRAASKTFRYNHFMTAGFALLHSDLPEAVPFVCQPSPHD